MNSLYKKCVFAGSFDPVTNGHEDVIRKSSLIFESVVVGVLNNPAKNSEFSMETKVEMLKDVCKKYPNVTVKSFDGMLVDFLKQEDCSVFVRGIRNAVDFEYETSAHYFNSDMYKDLITLYFPCDPENAFVSSSRIRELILYGRDVSKYVPKEILKYIKK